MLYQVSLLDLYVVRSIKYESEASGHKSEATLKAEKGLSSMVYIIIL